MGQYTKSVADRCDPNRNDEADDDLYAFVTDFVEPPEHREWELITSWEGAEI